MADRVLSTTALGKLAVCAKQYEYSEIDKLAPKPALLPQRIRQGLWIHRALQYNATGRPFRLALAECVDWVVKRGLDPTKAEAIRAECERIMIGYLHYWSNKPNGIPQVVAAEIPLLHRLSPTLSIRATADAVVQESNFLWLWEYKTTGEIPDPTWRAIDPQTALQYAAAKLSGRYDVVGIVFDYLLTEEPRVPRVKKNGEIYASDLTMTTTSECFDKAAVEISKTWNGVGLGSSFTSADECDAYIDRMRGQLVNDGKFYQRFKVFRPVQAVVETLRDVKVREAMLDLYEREAHYPRLNSLLYCRRFCTYRDLCPTEYTKGGIAAVMRQERFIIDDGSDREARDPVPQGVGAVV